MSSSGMRAKHPENDPTCSYDALVGELIDALREHPAGLLGAEMFALDGGRLYLACSRLWDVARGKP